MSSLRDTLSLNNHMTDKLDAFLIALLVILFCLRVWNLGIVHHDDAVWALRAWQGNFDVIWQWATSQGRVWALVSGPLLFYALKIKGSFGGDILLCVVFIIFFFSFYYLSSLYFGARVAKLAATFNVAFYAMRWEGSLITTYPAFTWILSTSFLAGVWFSRQYLINGKTANLFLAITLFFLSLFLHEGMTLLFLVLFPLAILANHRILLQRHISVPEILKTATTRKLVAGYIFASLLYVALYVLWRVLYPANYDGLSLTGFTPFGFIQVWINFTFSGSLIYDLFTPYTVGFSDALQNDSIAIEYPLTTYLSKLSLTPVILLYSVLVFFVCYRLLVLSAHKANGQNKAVNLLWTAGIGLVVALTPIFPVALTQKYQGWYLEHGIRSYNHTAFAHFGVSLFLASAVILAFTALYKKNTAATGLAFLLILLITVLSAAGFNMNNSIANDMRAETSRWKILNYIVRIVKSENWPEPVIFSPRFRDGSWFTVLDEGYWTQFALARYGVPLKFRTDVLSTDDLRSGAVLVDFYSSDAYHAPLLFLAKLKFVPGSPNSPISDQIYVTTPLEVSQVKKYTLLFHDIYRGPQSIRLGHLATIGSHPTVLLLNNILAYPGSIRIATQQQLSFLPITCDDNLGAGATVLFGSRVRAEGCIGNRFLRSGWNTPDAVGVWSNKDSGTLSLPLDKQLPPADLKLRLHAWSYTGMGFFNSTQTITIRLGNTILSKRLDKFQEPMKPIDFTIPRAMWKPGTPIELKIEVNKTFNPKALGVAADARDLGINVRALTILGSAPP